MLLVHEGDSSAFLAYSRAYQITIVFATQPGLLALLDFLGVKNVAKQMRHYCAQPREALQLLLGELSRENG
jgi:hypothetical protein